MVVATQAVAADRYAELPTLLRMVRLVRLVKIIRLFKAKRNFGALAELGVASRTVMRVLWLTFWMTAVGHVLGCFWVLVRSLCAWVCVVVPRLRLPLAARCTR